MRNTTPATAEPAAGAGVAVRSGRSRIAPGAAANRVLRELNRSMVVDALRDGGRMSRLDIVRRTGLSKQTVGSIVDELVRAGSAVELPSEQVAGRGRPPRLLTFNGSADAFVGIAVGGTRVRVGIADGNGRLLATAATPTVTDPARAVAQVAGIVAKLVAEVGVRRSNLRRAGVAAAGLIDRVRGRVVSSPNLGWGEVELGDLVSSALAVPVTVVNRVAAATLAEGRSGAARSTPSYAWVCSGTGIGAGIVIDGSLISGTSGFAGELGHSPIKDAGELCTCGNRGCLETVAGAAAIVHTARRAAAGRRSTVLRDLPAAEIAAADVSAAAAAGDRVAARILASAGAQLGLGVSHLINVLNPSMVVIGGPLSQSRHYLDAVCASVERHTLRAERVPVVHSLLGPEATLLGAIQVAIEGEVPSYRIVDIRTSSA